MAKTITAVGRLPKGVKKWPALAEAAFKVRAKRKVLQAQVEALEGEERAIKEHIISQLSAAEIESIKCRFGSLSLREKDVPKVVDKEAFGKWVARHQAWDLLYGKAVEEGCQARWEESVEIDGIEKYHDKKLTLTESK